MADKHSSSSSSSSGDNRSTLQQREEENIATIDIRKELASINERLSLVQKTVSDINSKHSELDYDVNGEGGVSEIIEGIQYSIEDISKDRNANTQGVHNIESDFLKALVKKQGEEIHQLRSEMDDLKNKSYKKNIVLHNIPEIQGRESYLQEDAKNALSRAGHDILTVRFDQMYRVGPVLRTNSRFMRDIVATPHYPEDRDKLLSLKISLTDKKRGPWISPHYSEQIREARRQLGSMADARRKRFPNANVKLRFNTLTMNGQVIKPAVSAPDPTFILDLDQDDRHQLHKVQFKECEPFSETGSRFTARSTQVKNLTDVRRAYQALYLNPDNIKATHNIVAYILPNGGCGYCDDRDYGMGRAILRIMEEFLENGRGYAVFISRHYGGERLGGRRFEIVEELTNRSMELILGDEEHVTYLTKPTHSPSNNRSDVSSVHDMPLNQLIMENGELNQGATASSASTLDELGIADTHVSTVAKQGRYKSRGGHRGFVSQPPYLNEGTPNVPPRNHRRKAKLQNRQTTPFKHATSSPSLAISLSDSDTGNTMTMAGADSKSAGKGADKLTGSPHHVVMQMETD